MAAARPSAETLNAAANLPLSPNEQNTLLGGPPRASFFAPTEATLTPQHSGTFGSPLLKQGADNEALTPAPITAKPKPGKRWFIIAALLAAVGLLIIVIIVPVYFTVIRPKEGGGKENAVTSHHGSSSSAGSNGSPSPTSSGNHPESPDRLITGGDKSTVTKDDGTTFVYNNQFGGYWWHDPNDLLSNNARVNSFTPPLNQTWKWGTDRIYGVNLGGWFVLEPFITPALFQKYPGAADEWDISVAMAADTSPGGGLAQLENHYATFITEEDIAEIAGAGLNWVRLPIPFWTVQKWDNEPFLEKTSWKYILRAIEWCRKYGIRVNIDLHTIPGSQNGYNHSGKGGQINFLYGVMGYANAQRALDIIRIISEFFAQPQYYEVVGMFGIMNEPLLGDIGVDSLSSFYREAYETIRGITGIGEGKGFYISYHDGFSGLSNFAGFLRGADRIAMDSHPYMAFDGSSATDPMDTGVGEGAGGVWPGQACSRWSSMMDNSRASFGVTTAGEYSNGFNDCGFFLRGITNQHSFGGDCSVWEDSTNWTEGTKAGLLHFALASLDALGDAFFWTWKIDPMVNGIVGSPLWSYRLGLLNGWMPTDPRTSVGTCAALGYPASFSGTYEPWQTGGVGAGATAAAVADTYPWPPIAISNGAAPALLPSYTPTAPIPTLPPITFTPAPTPTADVGDGWFNAADTTGAMTEIAGCVYPDAWNAIDAAIPPLCGVAAAKAAAPTH